MAVPVVGKWRWLRPGGVTRADVDMATIGLLTFPHQWEQLRLALLSLRAGDSTAIAEIARGTYDFTNPDGYAAISCADAARPREVERTNAFYERQESMFPGQGSVCDEWSFEGTDRPVIPQPSPALPALLFVAHEFDPTTPRANARRMASAFYSPLITRQGDGHTLVLHGVDACVDDKVAGYLLDPQQQLRDAWCPATSVVSSRNERLEGDAQAGHALDFADQVGAQQRARLQPLL